jgi:PST family polysaccharide transporter
MSLTQKTIKAGSWHFMSLATKAILQLLVIAILARHVLPEEFGYIALANIVLVFVEMFAEAGLGPAIVQKKELREEHIRIAFTLSVTLGMLFVFVLWIGAPWIATFFKAKPLLSVIRWLGFSVLITKLGMVARSLIERDMRFDKLMRIDIGSYIFGYALVGIILALLGYGVWAIVAGKLVQCSLQSIFLFISRPHSIKVVFSTNEYKELLTFGGGLTLSRIFDNAAGQGDYFIVGRFLQSKLLGFYERASFIMMVPGQYLGLLLDKVLFPAMSKIQDQSKRLENAYLRGISVVNIILVPMSILMIVVAPELILILLGPNWTKAIVPLQILLVTISFRIYVNISDTLVRAKGAVYASAARKAVFAFFIIFGSWIGKHWGLAGVAVAVNVAVIINYILMTQLSIRVVNGKWRDYLKVLKNGFIIGGILLVVSFTLVKVLRLYTDSALLILFTTGICGGSILIIIFLLFPRILGCSGFWLLYQLIEALPWKHPLLYRLSAFTSRAIGERTNKIQSRIS